MGTHHSKKKKKNKISTQECSKTERLSFSRLKDERHKDNSIRDWHIQTHSMWIGITDEMQNRSFKEHNWIQPSFKVGNRQTTYVERQDKDESESMTNNLH